MPATWTVRCLPKRWAIRAQIGPEGRAEMMLGELEAGHRIGPVRAVVRGQREVDDAQRAVPVGAGPPIDGADAGVER